MTKPVEDPTKAALCERTTTTLLQDKGRMTFKVDAALLAQCEAITTANLLALEKKCMDKASGVMLTNGVAPFDACMRAGIPTIPRSAQAKAR